MINSFPDIDIAAVSIRADRPLLLWYVFRSLDHPGVGHLVHKDFATACRLLKITYRNALDLIRSGEDLYWTSGPCDDLFLRSAARVALSLGVPWLRTGFVRPLKDFARPLGTARAQLALRAVAAIREGKPTSVAVLAVMFNVSCRTVRLWKRRCGLRSIENYSLIAPSDVSATLASFRLSEERTLHRLRYGDQIWWCKQLASSFEDVPGKEGFRSRLRRFNRQLRQLSGGRATFDSTGEGNTRPRRRYWTGKELKRAQTPDLSSPDAYRYVGVGSGPAGKVRLWERLPINGPR